MEKIELKDLNLALLTKMKSQGTKSIIYEYGNICLKLFNDLTSEEQYAMYKKLLEMEELNINGVLFPKALIMDNNQLKGYIMDNFKDSLSLYDYFTSERFVNCKDIFSAVKKSSLILRDIHSKGIICEDLSFDNILIDKKGNIKYCDIDSWYYKGYMAPYISLLLKSFLIDYRKINNNLISKNMDRLSLMLAFFYLMYLKELPALTKKDYRLLSLIKTLRNMQEYGDILINKKNTIPNIPYLDSLIDDKDDYVIDRLKQLGLKERILKKYS